MYAQCKAVHVSQLLFTQFVCVIRELKCSDIKIGENTALHIYDVSFSIHSKCLKAKTAKQRAQHVSSTAYNGVLQPFIKQLLVRILRCSNLCKCTSALPMAVTGAQVLRSAWKAPASRPSPIARQAKNLRNFNERYMALRQNFQVFVPGGAQQQESVACKWYLQTSLCTERSSRNRA